jgi:hypothetical protein
VCVRCVYTVVGDKIDFVLLTARTHTHHPVCLRSNKSEKSAALRAAGGRAAGARIQDFVDREQWAIGCLERKTGTVRCVCVCVCVCLCVCLCVCVSIYMLHV